MIYNKLSYVPGHPTLRQQGLSLVELLIALAIGLIITIAAGSIFIVARQGAQINDDRSRLLENGRLAVDILTRNIRMAGSPDLRPATLTTNTPIAPAFAGLPSEASLQGTEGGAQPDSIVIGYRSIDAYNSATLTGADCTGQSVGIGPVVNTFTVQATNQQLMCVGNGGGAGIQPIVGSVVDMQLQYSVVTNWTPWGPDELNPSIAVVDAGSVTNWAQVRAVHVCLELASFKQNALNPGTTSGRSPGLDCRNAAFPADNRAHRTFRTVVNIRNASPGNLFANLLP